MISAWIVLTMLRIAWRLCDWGWWGVARVCSCPSTCLRSPSPEPIYNNEGKRLNTREYRTRKKLEEDRHRLVQEASALNTDYKPPADYKWVLIWHIDNQSVGAFEMTFGRTKGVHLSNIINGDVILLFRRLMCNAGNAHIQFDVTCFPAFVRAWEIISRFLSLR